MTKKVYHLANCKTCQRIISELGIGEEFEYQNIKVEKITETQLDEMYHLVGSYEALFSRRSRKYRAWELHTKTLTEDDYRSYILKEYTFLKRPVFIIGDEIFIGNAKKTVAAVAKVIQ